MNKILTNIFYIIFPLLIGSIVGIITSGYIDYETLTLPSLAPPKIFFPIVWTIIYILMGISYYLIKKDNKQDLILDVIYYGQLAVNALWSIIFFIFKWRFFAIVWIVLLLLLIILLLIKFYQRNKTAALLNIPYLLWTTFATYLTIAIYILN